MLVLNCPLSLLETGQCNTVDRNISSYILLLSQIDCDCS